MPKKSRSKINYVQCANCGAFKVKPERAEQYPSCYTCWKEKYNITMENYKIGNLDQETTVKCLKCEKQLPESVANFIPKCVNCYKDEKKAEAEIKYVNEMNSFGEKRTGPVKRPEYGPFSVTQ